MVPAVRRALAVPRGPLSFGAYRHIFSLVRKGGGIGFIVVLIAAAIVMILAMRQWLAVAPTAQQIMAIDQANRVASGQAKGKGKAKAKPVDHGQGSVEDQQKRGVLPDLQDMKDGTDEHAKQVDDAVKQSNQ